MLKHRGIFVPTWRYIMKYAPLSPNCNVPNSRLKETETLYLRKERLPSVDVDPCPSVISGHWVRADGSVLL